MSKLSNKKIEIIILIFLLITIKIYQVEQIKINNQFDEEKKDNNRKHYTTIHHSIEITSDDNFSSFPGSGTKDDPYIIKDYIIYSSSKYGIYIFNTTKYFIVQNCKVKSSYLSGLYISHIKNGTGKILDNEFNSDNYGIYVDSSNNLSIINNIYLAKYGIYMHSSANNYIAKNEFYSLFKGINIIYSNNITIENNTYFESTQISIRLLYSSNNTIINNTFTKVKKAIYIYYSFNNFLTGNNFTNNEVAINLIYSDKNFIFNNSFQLSEINSINLESSLNNSIINNSCFYCDNNSIYLINSEYNLISNNSCYNCNSAIYLHNSSYNLLEHNRLINNLKYGLLLISSNNNDVKTNIIVKNSFYGINLLYSKNNTIWLNYIVFNNVAVSNSVQVNDNNGLNYWYEPIIKKGNYWNEFTYGKNYSINPGLTSDLYPQNSTDTDDDGLQDVIEINCFFTNIFSNDTDSDGIIDYWEIDNNFNPLINDSSLDLDRDNLSNLAEYQNNTDPHDPDTDDDDLRDGDEVNIYLTDPLDSDTDDDGMPDGWEVENCLNPLENDSYNDPDDDSLVNLEEYNYSTNPTNNDTDGDGLSDYNEIYSYNSDPTDIDTDNDGLFDGQEVNLFLTNPLDSDTDNDKIDDYSEVYSFFTDPNCNDTDNDGLLDGQEAYIFFSDPNSNDTDLDGLSDYEEIIYNTNLKNSDTDFDGLSDYEEIKVYFTNPRSKDTDRDGRSDGWEIENGYNPLMKNVFFVKKSILMILFYINISYSILIFLLLLYILTIKKILIQFFQWQEEHYLELNKLLIQYEKATKIVFLSDFIKDLTPVINQTKEEVKSYPKLSLIKKINNTKQAYKLWKKKIDINKYEKMYNDFYFSVTQLNFSEIKIIDNNNDISVENEKFDTLLKEIINERRMLKQYKNLITDMKFIFSFLPRFLDENKKLFFKQINEEIEEKFENANSLLIKTLKLSIIKGNKLLEKEEQLSKQIIKSLSKEILHRFAIYENELKEWKKRSENVLSELLEEDLKEVEDLFQEEKNMLKEIIVQNEIKYKEVKRVKVLIDVLSIYSEIPLIKLQRKLGFSKLEDLEKWLIELSSFLSIKIEGDKLIISEKATKELTQSIDELIKRFTEWEKTGEGKKT
ncbi:MAG: right-handed parallel beta-helix repeat-containing protein [Candidatus Heimdallarchaeum endolithica]|uniref:Probable pectate lyase C n=1 Tax=Candidatus Heimdallarchaeum endolithica TaxID=2876572 RepID=A0A9Y1BTG6_9ARCH|nr:MAG: right-handed parallel beta-helix repeat-containing protein [Candidatus Heimdallarchaeum endolithica]